jgi:hypothetical protein
MLIFLGCASGTAKQQEVAAPPPAPAPAPAEQSLDYLQCAGNEFRGFGIGGSRDDALKAAYSDLAKQVSSSINVVETRGKSQSMYKGEENISSEYDSKIVIKANLSNISDAYVLRIEQRLNGNIETVVCMSRANAAKGFIERERLIADSLDLLADAALNTEHPKRKNDAWRKSQMLWGESIKVLGLLESWGVMPATPGMASQAYSKIRDDYKNYCQSQKVYWEENAESECSSASFSELSRRIKIEKSQCLSGLKFKFSCGERCKASSYGIECFFEPSLAIESCNAEMYSLLRVKETISGTDMNSENRAKDKLVESLPRAVFFNEWEREIKEWMPLCAE